MHLWWFSLDQPPMSARQGRLSPAEEERAQQFRLPTLQTRYRYIRRVLRSLLATQLNCLPTEVVIETTPTGKPALIAPQLSPPLTFNLSHSGNVALIGVNQGDVVGVDVEKLKPMPQAMAIAKRFFAPVEYRHLCRCSSSQQASVFLQYWTAKEAFLKAIGQGISGGLDQVIVQPDFQRYQSLPPPAVAQHWRLLSCSLADDYWAAVATPQENVSQCPPFIQLQ